MRQLGIKVLDGKIKDKINPKIITKSDIAVIQRDFPRDLQAYKKLLQLAQQEQKPIVYDLDDLLLLFPEEHPERYVGKYVESLLPMIQVLYEADLVTTTTPYLQNWLKQYNDQVSLLPNYFDDALWNLREPVINADQETPLIIGYMGSASHKPDLEYISPVLVKLIKRFPKRLEFHFWGINPPEKIAKLPQVKWIPAVAYEYEDFAAYFQTQYADIFIAPLTDSPFNRGKSPLKFFEYTALGAPGVYSKLETFEQTITHNYDGLLASSLEEWEEYLIALIDNHELRLKLANNAQQTIKERWLLSKNAYRWIETYENLVNKYETIQKSKDQKSKDQDYFVIKTITQQYDFLHNSLHREIFTQDLTIQEKDSKINAIEAALTNLEKKIVILSEEKSILENRIVILSDELSSIKGSRAWKIALLVRKIRQVLVPTGSKRASYLKAILHWMKNLQARLLKNKGEQKPPPELNINAWVPNCLDVPLHSNQIDIIVCVHNAYEDVEKCLNSVIANTNQPYKLIIVDDGSDLPTKSFLEAFVSSQTDTTLIRNEKALGYTKAANVGIKASVAPFFVLLNSDTIVPQNWLDRLYRAITNDEKIGIVGPLSNTASWQSIPKLSDNGDWAINELPQGVTVKDMSALIAKYSACIHPKVPLLNGFCLMVRKEVVNDIGIFDEHNFGQGYGEEDDFMLRASQSGWKAVIVDDAYIFHAQSKSYTNSTRFALQKRSGQNLLQKHGAEKIAQKVEFMNPNRVIEGIRARARIMLEREDCIEKGRQSFSNKKLLFVLPVLDAGGGANVILDEARNMAEMGVEVSIFNLSVNESGFLRNYAHIDLPFLFRHTQDIPDLATAFDAVVASAHYSVPWFEPFQKVVNKPILGYYVQGFEPLMYPSDSEEYTQALETYTKIHGMKKFTKTQWTRISVLEHTGSDSEVIGISVNIDLFRPRDMIRFGTKPVTIVAMVRPASPYRNPEMTIAILKEIKRKFKKNVEVWLFGADNILDVVDERLLNFKWQNLGKLTQVQVAAMMSRADIFTDFSSHQAMGLSALEAMAAGCAVIVPSNGGAIEFVKHRHNGIVADTSNFKASVTALEELVADDQLRKQIQLNAINDVVQYYPEKPSYNILKTLFGE